MKIEYGYRLNNGDDEYLDFGSGGCDFSKITETVDNYYKGIENNIKNSTSNENITLNELSKESDSSYYFEIYNGRYKIGWGRIRLQEGQ